MPRPALARRLLVAVLLAAAVLVAACNKKKPAAAENPENPPPPVAVPSPPGAAQPGSDIPTEAAKPAWLGATVPGTNVLANVPAAIPDRKSPWAGTAIPCMQYDPVTFGPPGCPVLVVGQTVYDAKTYQPVRKLPEKYDPLALHALTPDGRYFASGSKPPYRTEIGVTVWATDTGERVLDVSGAKNGYAGLVAFLGNTHLLAGWERGPEIEVWDLKTRKAAGKVEMPDKQKVSAGKVGFSPDGKQFAAVGEKGVVVAEVGTKMRATAMAPPTKLYSRPPDPRELFYLYAHAGGLAYSPDGKELAMYASQPTGGRLLVWNTKGEMVLDADGLRLQNVGRRVSLEWLPDGSGWLVNGCLIDRATRRVAARIRVPGGTGPLPHLLDRDRVIGQYDLGTPRPQLQTLILPRGELSAALRQMTARTGAYLTPGEPVSLYIELTGVRGDHAEPRRILAGALARRLARDGIGVAAGRPTVLWVRLSEQAGETLPVYSQQVITHASRLGGFTTRGELKATGQTVTTVKGAAVLELWAQGVPQPLWRDYLRTGSGTSFADEITDEKLRKSMIDNVGARLSDIDLPYFIPKSKDVFTLPVVVE